MKQLGQRIKKLERKAGVDDEFCRCGTPYYASFVIGGEDIINNECPDCKCDVKPQTIAEFVKEAYRYKCVVIEPKADERGMI